MTVDDVTKRTAKALRELREAVGLSLTDFATKAGLPVDRVAHIEDGKYDPVTISTLCVYAEILGIPLPYFADTVLEPFEQMTETLKTRENKRGQKRTRKST